MELKYQQGTPATLHLALLPLKEVGPQIVADMQAAGTGRRCGVCGKPFDGARKYRSVARVTYFDGRVYLLAWKLCGKCTHETRRNGGKVPDCLRQEAESVCGAARLMAAEAEGTA